MPHPLDTHPRRPGAPAPSYRAVHQRGLRLPWAKHMDLYQEVTGKSPHFEMVTSNGEIFNLVQSRRQIGNSTPWLRFPLSNRIIEHTCILHVFDPSKAQPKKIRCDTLITLLITNYVKAPMTSCCLGLFHGFVVSYELIMGKIL